MQLLGPLPAKEQGSFSNVLYERKEMPNIFKGLVQPITPAPHKATISEQQKPQPLRSALNFGLVHSREIRSLVIQVRMLGIYASSYIR